MEAFAVGLAFKKIVVQINESFERITMRSQNYHFCNGNSTTFLVELYKLSSFLIAKALMTRSFSSIRITLTPWLGRP